MILLTNIYIYWGGNETHSHGASVSMFVKKFWVYGMHKIGGGHITS